MSALIGITSEFKPRTIAGRAWNAHLLYADYTEALRAAGGLPVVLPMAHGETCEGTLERLDGLILTGDVRDVPPSVLNERPHSTVEAMPLERWESECLWLETAKVMGLPTLCICVGMQIMNAVEGGTLIQDLPGLRPECHDHNAEDFMCQHEVTVTGGTRLAELAPSSRVTITSSHHQAVDAVAPGYRVSARSDDGVVEAIEGESDAFLLGVQWHPERNLEQPDWLLLGFARHCESA